MRAAMRRRVLDALFLHFSSERAPLIVHGLLMKSQCGRSCSRTCGRAPSELRGVFQDRMFPAATLHRLQREAITIVPSKWVVRFNVGDVTIVVKFPLFPAAALYSSQQETGTAVPLKWVGRFNVGEPEPKTWVLGPIMDKALFPMALCLILSKHLWKKSYCACIRNPNIC